VQNKYPYDNVGNLQSVTYPNGVVAATTNVATLLAHVRTGAEVVIENSARPVPVLRSAEPHPGRLLSESIALAEAHGSTVTLEGNFARDLEEISKPQPFYPPQNH
jgi:antitoxin (DNA-binding transcriptional repressor) of toxin-antitoxin stability system